MINGDSVRAVASAQWTDRFITPLYDSYCFAQIPRLVRHLFGGTAEAAPAYLLGPLFGAYDTVILFFVDAFGWRFFEQYRETSPFLRRFVEEGYVTKLTSQFPSTTAAHVTAIHTGLPVGQSGVYEWFYYEPQLDAVIAPLYFSFAGDRERETLRRAGVSPAALFPERTLYQDLQDQGVASVLFQFQGYTPSSYTDTMARGARVVPYRRLSDALPLLADLLRAQTAPSYYVLYFDLIDATSHHYGPASPQVAAQIETLLDLMEQVFQPILRSARGTTLFLLTADHGQVAIDPATTIYLNLQEPEIVPTLKVNRAGRPLVPAGAPRDMFLHVQDGALDQATSYLEERLDGHADVYRVRDLIARGFFGTGEPSPVFLGRVGDVVVLPYEGESVWWYEADRFSQGYYGHHGGLTRPEMETLLLAHADG